MYKKNMHIHFVGIGGIGMSGVAEILLRQGYHVSGCDLSATGPLVERLLQLGCSISVGHDPEHLHDVDVLVFSSIILPHNPEIVSAMGRNIPVIPRALMLAELMRTKYSVAVSGAHGKTTTTSMISHIFIEAGLDPTVIVGGILRNISTHAQLGHGQVLIAEADESDRSFLHLNPTTAVVTNIDAEHLSTYKDLDDVCETFRNFLGRLPFYGLAIVCIDDVNIRRMVVPEHIRTIAYGTTHEAHVQAVNVDLNATYSSFEVLIQGRVAQGFGFKASEKAPFVAGTFVINMPGIHNVRNALAAITLALEYEIPLETVRASLASFAGVQRRFEFKGTCNGAEIFDDYGHHPNEVYYTLLAAKRRAQGRLMVIFQPHRFSRTHKLWPDFVRVLTEQPIARLYLTDIYPAFEAPIEGVTSQRLAEDIKRARSDMDTRYLPTYGNIIEDLKNDLRDGDLIITIGAGPVNLIAEELAARKS